MARVSCASSRACCPSPRNARKLRRRSTRRCSPCVAFRFHLALSTLYSVLLHPLSSWLLSGFGCSCPGRRLSRRPRPAHLDSTLLAAVHEGARPAARLHSVHRSGLHSALFLMTDL